MKSRSKFTVISLFLILSGCTEAIREKEIETPVDQNTVVLNKDQYNTIGLETGKVELKSLSGIIKVNGMLDVPPQNLVSISTPLSGFVKNTELLQGMKVKKGQVVANIQNADFVSYQQDYLDFSSQLDYLKLENERQQELSDADVGSKKTAQKAKSEYESMKARVNGLKARLQLMNINLASLEKGNIQTSFQIYSPISGYVTQVNTNIGQYADPSDILFQIVDTEHLHVELTVFEKDIPKLKEGRKVRFILVNEEKERLATIYLIGREISNERTVKVHCHLDKEDIELLPGTYLKALVETGSEKVSVLPEKAIVGFEGNQFIFIQKRSPKKGQFHFEMLQIKTGVSEFGYTEVHLSEHYDWSKQQVVTVGTYDLLSALKNKEEEE